MTEEDDGGDALNVEFGITAEDMEQIEAFLSKRQFERSPEDLRPTSDVEHASKVES